MSSGSIDVSVATFLKVLFPPGHRGLVDLVEAVPGADRKLSFVDKNASSYEDHGHLGALYYCISTCDGLGPRSRRPSRKHPVLTYVIVLDDVGTKIALDRLPPGLRPTYALETSPGNFQVGFRFTTAVEPHRAAALIEALARADFTDAGAQGAVRIMRVPGSLNGKPQHGDWRARLTTWNPEVSYTLSELAAAFNVTPSDTPALATSSVPTLEPGQTDAIAEWAVAHAGEVGGASGPPVRDLIPVICPQQHLHTVGVERSNDSSTVWIPGAPGAFKCTHGHCNDFRTREYLAWIRSTYLDVPADRPTSVDLDALAEGLRRAVEASPPGARLFTPPPAAGVRGAILGDLVKVGSRDRYFTIQGQEYMTRAGVDDHWAYELGEAGLLDALTPTGRPTTIAPHVWLRRQPDVRRVAKVVHRLGQPTIVGGDLNIAPPIPARPDATGVPTPWLELVNHLAGGDPALYDHMIDWFAMCVGCWTEKPGWHILMRGGQGTGKDMVALPLRQWLGEHHTRVEVTAIGGNFHPFLMKKLCTVDELKMTTRGSTTAHDVYNTLKAWTTRGNETVVINIKFGEITALDLSCWILTSNEDVPMPLDRDDRRFLVVEPPPPKPLSFYRNLKNWLDAGGTAVVIAWLWRQWDAMGVEQMEALRGHPPTTIAKTDLIEGSAEGIAGAVRMLTSGRMGMGLPDIVTLSDVLENLRNGPASDILPDAYRKQLSLQRVAAALKASGWVKMFNGDQVQHDGTRIRLWCRTAQGAVLHEQLGAGKALIERYRAMKLPGYGEGGEVVAFRPLAGGGDKS